jgi:hypothetical protein
LEDASVRPCRLDELNVITAHTADEYADTYRDVETYVLPLLRKHRIPKGGCGMKRKAAQSNSSSVARQGILYEEATGKTVDFIRYAEQSSGWPAFEVRFSDGTFLFIEPVPNVQFRVRLLKARKGNVKIIREYGVTG